MNPKQNVLKEKFLYEQVSYSTWEIRCEFGSSIPSQFCLIDNYRTIENIYFIFPLSLGLDCLLSGEDTPGG